MSRPLSERLLLLSPAELRRAGPFFALYILVFAVLTVAEGVSMALFVQRVGAASLPQWYGAMAVANLVLVGGYVALADRFDSARMFRWITGSCAILFFGVWALVSKGHDSNLVLGSLFASREIAYTLFLMHFGTFLQDHFRRDELLRVMPIVYAGGRVGGMAGGLALSTLSGPVAIIDFLLACGAIAAVAAWAAVPVARRSPAPTGDAEETSAKGVLGGGGQSADALDELARSSWSGFLRFLRISPLGFWYTLLSFVYVPCRWVLNYQYNIYFEGHFDDEVSMARFLGVYTQIGLGLSLLMQLVIVGRFVVYFGLHAAQTLYAVVLLGAMAWLPLQPSLPAALAARFAESELRFGWRNPINQLVVNKFSKTLRIRMRAWSIGVLIPVGTMVSALGLTAVARVAHPAVLGATGVGLALAYLGSSLRLATTFREPVRGVTAEAPPPSAER